MNKEAKKPTNKVPKFTEHKKYLNKVQAFDVVDSPVTRNTRVETLMLFSQLEKTIKNTAPMKSFIIDTKRKGSAQLFFRTNYPEMKFKCSTIPDNKAKTRVSRVL